MMLARRNRVCILSEYDADRLIKCGEMPPCRLHKHMARHTADRLTADSFSTAAWVGKSRNAIYFRDPKIWRTVPSGPFMVQQLVRE